MDEQKLIKKKRQAQKEHNWRSVADSSNKLGALFSDSCEYERAIVQFKDEFAAYKSLGMKMEAAHAERMIGEMLMYQGEYDSSLKFAQSYLKTAVEERNKVEEQRAYATIARIHLVHGQSEEEGVTRQRIINLAQKAFLEAALLCKSIEKQVGRYQAADMEARVYLNLGVCKEYCEEFEAAVDYMQTAIQIAKKFDLHELLYQCYTSAGLMHNLRTGDTRKSLLMFNLALQTAERLVDKTKKMCEVLQMKADVSLKIGDIQSAKQSLVQAFKMKCGEKSLKEIVEKTLRVLIAVEKAQDKLLNSDSQEYEVQKGLYETLGDGWCQLGNYSKAIEFYLKMLGCAELDGVFGKELVSIYVSLYQTYKDNKQYDLALDYMRKEHELIENNPKESFDTLMNIAEVQELAGRSFFEIEESYKKAQQLAKTMDDEMSHKRVLLKLLQLCRKHGMIMNEEDVSKEISDLGTSTDELERIFENDNHSPCSEEEPASDVPDIGHDIHLEDLFSSDDDRTPQKRDRPSDRYLRKRTGLNLQTKRNQKGETPLHLACISGNLTLVKQLLDQGHETIVRDNAGWIPLHEACNHGYKEIVEELLTRSRNRGINDRGGTKCDGVTPLYDACSNGNLEIVELLLERGADPTMKTNDGDSALNALELWRQSADRLSVAEENLYEALHQKIKHSLEKTGNLKNSKEMEGRRRSKSGVDDEVKSTSSSERRKTPKIRNIRQGLDISSSDDESDVDISANSRLTALVSKPSEISEQKRARSDYKDVMTKLRKPHSSNFPSHSPYFDTNEKKQSALISTSNVTVDDDWLEDDLGPKSKRQKFMQEPLSKKTSRHSFSPAKVCTTITPAKKKSSQEIDSTINDLSDWDVVSDGFGFGDENDVPLWQSTARPKFDPRMSLSPKRHNPIKRQSSLLSAGFSRSQSPQNVQADDIPDSTINEHWPSMPSPYVSAPERLTGLKTIVVKISDELISVPVKAIEIDNLDVGWLVNEVKRRYSNLFGRSPEIRITLDSALVETSDPLAIVFTATEIGARILKFNTISLMNRYRTACEERKTPIIDDIVNALELCLPSKRLNLEDQLLTAEDILPVAIAIKQETELISINLNNNWLQNNGIKHLSDAMVELKELEEIRLGGNYIEAEGVKVIFGNSAVLTNLNSLALDYNPFGDEGVKILLEKGLELCPKLLKLSLAGCEIKVIEGDPKLLRQLSHLNISENPLDRQSFEIVAKNIGRDKIAILNLNNISGQDSLNWFKLFQSPFPVLTELHLASNQLTDAIISELLSTCICLNLLDLSHNSLLTSATFEYFINKDAAATSIVSSSHISDKKRSAIQKIYLNGCQKLLPSPIPNTTITTTINTRSHISLPEYMELTLNITNPMEGEQQEKYIRKIWDDCYNNIISNDDDYDDTTTVSVTNAPNIENESRQQRTTITRNSRIGYVKVNKFHLTAFVLDTTD